MRTTAAKKITAPERKSDQLLAKAYALRTIPPPELPDWHDQKAMQAWVNAMLDRLHFAQALEAAAQTAKIEENDTAQFRKKMEETIAWYKADGPSVDAAEQGFLDPLRRAHPHLAKFLQLPKRK